MEREEFSSIKFFLLQQKILGEIVGKIIEKDEGIC